MIAIILMRQIAYSMSGKRERKMEQNLTCFKCHENTAILTYEENRIYQVSCPCGCEYTFEHSSMKWAEEYHLKMLELYGEIDRADRLKRENDQLRELVQLAAGDIPRRCHTCLNFGLNSSNEKFCPLMGRVNPQYGGTDAWDKCVWQWQHADKLQEMGIEV